MAYVHCPICFEAASEQDSWVVTSCGHCYHEKCLNGALERRSLCPNCNVSVAWTTRAYQSFLMLQRLAQAQVDMTCVTLQHAIRRGRNDVRKLYLSFHPGSPGSPAPVAVSAAPEVSIIEPDSFWQAKVHFCRFLRVAYIASGVSLFMLVFMV